MKGSVSPKGRLLPYILLGIIVMEGCARSTPLLFESIKSVLQKLFLFSSPLPTFHLPTPTVFSAYYYSHSFVMMEASKRVIASYKFIIPTFGSVRLEVDPEDYSLSPSKLPPPPSLEKPIASAVDFAEKEHPSKAWLIASIFMLQIFFISFDLWAVLSLNESQAAKTAWIVAWFLSAIGINVICVGIYQVKAQELEHPLRAHLKSLSKPGRTFHLRIMRQKHYLTDCASCGYFSPTSIRSRWEAFLSYRMERWFVDVLENEGESYVPIMMMTKPTLNAGEETEEAAAKAG